MCRIISLVPRSPLSSIIRNPRRCPQRTLVVAPLPAQIQPCLCLATAQQPKAGLSGRCAGLWLVLALQIRLLQMPLLETKMLRIRKKMSVRGGFPPPPPLPQRATAAPPRTFANRTAGKMTTLRSEWRLLSGARRAATSRTTS
jgi:hypothetical protein